MGFELHICYSFYKASIQKEIMLSLISITHIIPCIALNKKQILHCISMLLHTVNVERSTGLNFCGFNPMKFLQENFIKS